MKINKSILVTIYIIIALGLNQCYYDVEEEIYPKTECNTENISYTSDVVSILQTNCYICHSQAANLGGITLEGYNNLKIYVDSGRFLGAIKHDPGFSTMPQGAPQLPDCTISKIEKWILDGALNN